MRVCFHTFWWIRSKRRTEKTSEEEIKIAIDHGVIRIKIGCRRPRVELSPTERSSDRMVGTVLTTSNEVFSVEEMMVLLMLKF